MADESFHGPFSQGASSFGAANNLGELISCFSTNQWAPAPFHAAPSQTWQLQPPSAPNGMVHSNGRYGDAYPATPPPADGSRKRKTKGEASAADLMAPQMQLLLRLTSYLETTQSDLPNGNKVLPSKGSFQEMMQRACLKLLGSAPGASGSTSIATALFTHDKAPLKHARFTNNGRGSGTMRFKCALISPRATGALGDALTRPARRCPWRRNLRARRPAKEGAVPSVLFAVEGDASLRDDLFAMIKPHCASLAHMSSQQWNGVLPESELDDLCGKDCVEPPLALGVGGNEVGLSAPALSL